jgi:hypothetical protein
VPRKESDALSLRASIRTIADGLGNLAPFDRKAIDRRANGPASQRLRLDDGSAFLALVSRDAISETNGEIEPRAGLLVNALIPKTLGVFLVHLRSPISLATRFLAEATAKLTRHGSGVCWIISDLRA